MEQIGVLIVGQPHGQLVRVIRRERERSSRVETKKTDRRSVGVAEQDHPPRLGAVDQHQAVGARNPGIGLRLGLRLWLGIGMWRRIVLAGNGIRCGGVAAASAARQGERKRGRQAEYGTTEQKRKTAYHVTPPSE